MLQNIDCFMTRFFGKDLLLYRVTKLSLYNVYGRFILTDRDRISTKKIRKN